MASALFARRTDERGAAGRVDTFSAGLLADPPPAPVEVALAMDEFGLDLRGHVPTLLTASMVERADAVLGMALRHVQEAVLLDPSAWRKTFRLTEFVTRAEAIGPRRPDQGFRRWIDDIEHGRDRNALLARGADDDIADPFGGDVEEFQVMARQLDELVTTLADLLFP